MRLLPGGATAVVNRVKHMVRLGENSFQKRQLQEPAMQRTLLVLRAFDAMCRTYGAQDVVALATSAVRDADNGREFIRRIGEKTGLDFNIISGMEEARLIYLGVSSGLPVSLGQRLFIDIGGGSTELAVGNSADHVNLDSLKLGCVRLTNAFLQGHEDVVSPALFEEMRHHVRREAAHALKRIQELEVVEAVGSSGTAQALHAVAQRLELATPTGEAGLEATASASPASPASSASSPIAGPPSATPEQDMLTLDGLRRAAAHVCGLTLEQRRQLPGVSTRRAEVLVAGAAILLTLLEELHLDHMRVSSRTMQDGILVDYVRRHGLEAAQSMPSVREHSVLQLAHRCNFEELHARHMARLTLQLHDSAVDCGLMALEHQGRELLYYAALLHDIGIFIAYARHAAHGHYLIHNSELLGFHEQEVAFMALLTLFHSTRPSKKHAAFVQCDAALKTRLRMFSLFLSLAENMDRLHCQHVYEAAFAREEDGLVLRVHSRQASPVEVEAVHGMGKVLHKTLGQDVRIQFCTMT